MRAPSHSGQCTRRSLPAPARSPSPRSAAPHRLAERQITREVQRIRSRQQRRACVSLAVIVSSFVIDPPSRSWSLAVSGEGRETQSALLPALRRPAVGRANRKNLAALCLPRRSPVARCYAPAIPPRRIGEDSAARLVVKAKPSGGAPLRCSPLAPALTPALAAALAESPISAGLAAPSERPGLGARTTHDVAYWIEWQSTHARAAREGRAMATEPVTSN